MKDDTLVTRLSTEIDLAYEEHRVIPQTMLLVEARDRIEELNVALGCCAAETERLFRWINEVKGEKIVKIVREGI